jgi:hypothetical protein
VGRCQGVSDGLSEPHTTRREGACCVPKETECFVDVQLLVDAIGGTEEKMIRRSHRTTTHVMSRSNDTECVPGFALDARSRVAFN